MNGRVENMASLGDRIRALWEPGSAIERIRALIWLPAGQPPPAAPPEEPRKSIRSTVVPTPGGPSTLDDAMVEMAQARMLGAENILALSRERSALEALVAELRR